MEETTLVTKVQGGDMKAFEELFERYKVKAIRTAFLITGNRYTSEDIVQEAFVQCYLAIKTLKKPEQFKIWFFKLLTRIAWRQSSKERKLVPIEDIFEKAQQGKEDESIEAFHQHEEGKELYKLINELEDKHKTTIILFYYNDLSIKEIARIMGCLEGTVKSRLCIARKKLKGALELLDAEQEKSSQGRGQYDTLKTI